jgi:hypothetical protein
MKLALAITSRRAPQEVPNRDGVQQCIAIGDEDFASFPASGGPIFYQPTQPWQIEGSGRRWAGLEAIKFFYDAIARGRQVFVPVGYLQNRARRWF